MEDDKAGQILRFAPDAVSDPGAHAGPAKLARTGVHEQLGWGMIEKIRRARFHQGDLVDNRGGIGKEFRDPRSALAVLREQPSCAEQFCSMTAAHEGKALAFNKGLGDGLAVQLD